jgi:hypothetical protein
LREADGAAWGGDDLSQRASLLVREHATLDRLTEIDDLLWELIEDRPHN